MFTRSPLRRVLTVLTVSMVGLAPALVVAPAAHAAASALTSTSPTAFGEVPVGQLDAQDVVVTNTSTTTALKIDPSNSSNVNSIDFLIGPALAPTATSPTCLSLGANDLIPASIPDSNGHCTLGIYFLPTHFGARSTTMTIADDMGGSFALSVSGAGGAGYFLANDSAAWTTFGSRSVDLENGPIALAAPVVGISGTSSGDGFWLDASDGGVFTAGSATFLGSMGGRHLNQPVVGMAGTPSDSGYWLVASDGGIFTFGDAGFFGSTGNVRLNKPIVGMAATPTGQRLLVGGFGWRYLHFW